MPWQFWQKSAPGKLPSKVKQVLKAEFAMDDLTVDQMRLVGKKGRYSNRPTEFIRIFDPALIESGKVAPSRYDDFLAVPGNQRSLLFEGRIEKINDKPEVFLTQRHAA